jgi:hypothetical protein
MPPGRPWHVSGCGSAALRYPPDSPFPPPFSPPFSLLTPFSLTFFPQRSSEGGILHVTGASTIGSAGYLPQRAKRNKRAGDFCKTRVLRHKMSFRCVEMSLFISVTVSSFCLFSYTFRLRSSFINIFFSVRAPNASILPPPRPWNVPLLWMICSVSFASVWAFVLSPGYPVGAPRSAPVPSMLA